MEVELPQVRDGGDQLNDAAGMYRNLRIRLMELNFKVGVSNAESIVQAAAVLLRSHAARQAWLSFRPYYVSNVQTKMDRRFVDLIDQAWEQATSAAETSANETSV